MSGFHINWDFWQFLWGDYLGLPPGGYPKFKDRVTMLPPSKESLEKTKIFPLGVYREAWELWNADLVIADRYLHPMSVPGDARSLFSNWHDFFNAGQPWTYGTGKYPIHISMLISQWEGLHHRMELHRQEMAKIGQMGRQAEEETRREREELWRHITQRSGMNPYLISAIFQAGTGQGINVPVQGPLGMSMINGRLERGLRPSSDGSSGLGVG